MPSKKTSQVKTRRAKAANLAVGISSFWAISIYAYLSSGGKSNTGTYLVLFTLAAAAAWAWAIMKIRADQGAGKTLAELQALSPDEFEDWVGARFRDMGYSVKTTGAGGDHGIDLIAERGDEIAVIQCKNYRSRSVGEPVLRDLFGTMHHFEGTKAYLVTTGQLTQAAKAWVKGKPIEVWDDDRVAAISAQFARKTTEKAVLARAAVAAATEIGPVETAQTEPTAAGTCPRCGSALVERRNRQSGDRFLGCSSFPRCRYIQEL